MLKDDHVVMSTDVKEWNTIRGVTWRSVHEHMCFPLLRAHQCYLFMNSKHHKSDALQVAIQLLVVTTSELHMII